MGIAQHSRRGLVSELQRSHVFIMWVLSAILVLSMVSSGYLLIGQHRLQSDTDLVRIARDARDGMVDQETGLRGWLATGDEAFLGPYESGHRVADAAFEQLSADVESTPELAEEVVAMLLARERWEGWATEASVMRVGDTDNDRKDLAAFLLRGKDLFDVYRSATTPIIRLSASVATGGCATRPRRSGSWLAPSW